MILLVVVAVLALVCGAAVGFVAGSRNAHRIVARLSPQQKLAFARKVSQAAKS